MNESWANSKAEGQGNDVGERWTMDDATFMSEELLMRYPLFDDSHKYCLL